MDALRPATGRSLPAPAPRTKEPTRAAPFALHSGAGIAELADSSAPSAPLTRIAGTSLSAAELMKFVRQLCATPHRRPGTPEGNAGEHFIARSLASLGLQPVIEPVAVNVRDYTKTSLVVHAKTGDLAIDTSFVNTTAFTPDKGLTSDLVYIGEGNAGEHAKADVKGKLAVMKLRFNFLPTQALTSRAFAIHDPDETFKKSYGAPYGGPDPQNSMLRELPAGYISKESGKALIDLLAREGPLSATFTSTGTATPGHMHNIHAVLPGKSSDAIIIHSHSDAPHGGWVEDDTGMATLYGLAEYFSKLPLEQREKT